MTTTTIFGIAGPFSNVAGNRLEPTTEFILLDKITRSALILPAGNVVTEIAVRRRADQGMSYDLTSGRGIAVGVNSHPRLFTGTPGILTNDLNVLDLTPDNPLIPYTHFVKVDPTSNISKLLQTSTQDQTFVLQSAFGGNVIDGGVSVVIKYKPFSDSVADRLGNQFQSV